MGIESYYITGFEIQRVTQVDDGAGSFTETLTKVADTVGRMRQLNGNEILANEKLGLITSNKFYCPLQDVTEDDYVYNSVKDKLYEIKSIKNPMEMDVHLEIDCLYKKDHQ